MNDLERAPAEGRAGRIAIRLLASLQAHYREVDGPAYFADCPDARRPCASCAIQEYGNRAQGQARTALTLFTALASHQAFLCHKGAPYEKGKGWAVDRVNGPLCVAYWAMAELSPDVLWQMFRDAVRPEYGELPDADHEEALDLITAFLFDRLA